MLALRLATATAALSFFLAVSASDAATSKYRVLWRTDPSSTAVIGWAQGTGTGPTVYYGPVDYGTNWASYPYSKAVDRSVAQNGMTHNFARLSGLSQHTNYYYVIRDSEGTSIRMWFKTAPSVGNIPFSYIAGGDSRNNRTPRQNANKMVAKLRPLFVLFGGDMTDQGTNLEWADWWEDWQLTRSTDGRMYPIVAARGNHESSNAMIHNMFDTPSADVYYALDVGGSLMRLYTLNTEMSISGTQTTWLTSDLSGNDARTWKIAQYHKPMRPHVAAKAEGTAQYSNWAAPFYNHRMNLVVECDAHTVKHTWPVKPSTGTGSSEGFIREDGRGTVYVGEGTWGAPLRTNDDNKAWTRNSAMFNAVHWVHVTADTMGLRTIKVDNVANVGTVSDGSPFALPTNLDVWSPSNGSYIKFLPISNSSGTVSSRVNSGSNDAEENASTGAMNLTSTDLELVTDGTAAQKIGMRFTGITVPKSATITNAYIQFTVDETSSTSTSLTFRGQAADNAGTFTTSTGNIGGRALTSASVAWTPPAWGTVGAAGADQRTPNLSPIIAEITSRSGWSSGNALVVIVTGTGKRTAEAYEGSASQAPLLVINYSSGLGKQGAEAIVLQDAGSLSPLELDGVKLHPNHLSASRGGSIRILNLPERSAARIYDVRGTLIHVLGASPALGSLEWNGRTANGQTPVGAYFLRLSQDEKQKVLPLWIHP